MRFYIQNMKCARCKLLVRAELEKIGIRDVTINAGEVEIGEDFPEATFLQLKTAMHDLQLELIEDGDEILVDKIKTAIHEIAFFSGDHLNANFSTQIGSKLGYSYKFLNQKFAAKTGIPLMRYFVLRKMEHIKEILIHENLSISQIAVKKQYSSVSHLSNQFKKETGTTPTQFRQNNRDRVR